MTMKKGSSGDMVRTLQTLLAALGYDVGAADGKFGKRTDAAVRVFQMRAGLVVDGIAGPKTVAALAAGAGQTNLTPEPVVEVGPFVEPPAVCHVEPEAFDADGWYIGARRNPLHAGRLGGVITPKGAVMHTTDTLGGMAGMMRRWATERGEGNGAHFMLGREAPTAAELINETHPSNGLAQMAPITRNGNHAGGPSGRHGRVHVPGDVKGWHPNAHYVGIEVVAGGQLSRVGSAIVHQGSGRPVPPDDVWLDERGRPWHRITEYQFAVLAELCDALDRQMDRFPDGAQVQSNGSYKHNAVMWAAMPGARWVGHVTLDPTRKTDPGPQLIEWMRARYGDRG